MEVINDKGAVLSSTTIGADGSYSVQVAKGANYFLRASKGNASLKAYVEKADSNKTIGISSGSSAVVKVMQQKLNVTDLGEPGADVSHITVQTDVAAIARAIASSGTVSSQVAQIAQAIATDITQNANFTAVSSAVTAGATSLAGNSIVASVVNNVVINNIAVSVITSGQVPSSPVGISAVAGNGTATISWNAVTDASTYGVYWGTISGQYNAFKRGLSGTSTTISGLTSGTTYYFVVTARNAYGESSDSAEVSAALPVPAPFAPSSPAAAAGNAQTTVSWTAVTGAASYNIYWKTTAGVTKTNGTKIAGATSPYVHTGLTNGTAYYYVVTAQNAGGESAASSEVTATPQLAIPLAPSGVSATGGDKQATVSWTSVTGAASYNIYWKTTAGVTKTNGTKITGAISPYVHTGRTNGTAYYYIVTAVNAGGESAASSEVTVTPQVPTPSAPSAPGVTAGNTQVTVSWTAVTGATSYNIYWGTSAGVTKTTGTKITGAISPYVHTGRTNGTAYYYIVTAVNAGGESAASSEVTVTPQVPVPSAPSSPAAAAGNAQTTVSWTAVTGAASYNIYWKTTAGVTKTNGTKITGVTSPYVHTGRTNGTAYYYIVTAVNAGGESAASSETTSTPVAPPAAPVGTATQGNGLVTISWAPVTGATSYNIYWKAAAGVAKTNGTKIAGAISPYVHTGRTNGTAYYYIVTAVNAGGESAASSEVSATPQLAIPLAPSGVSATGGDKQVTVSWTASDSATSYTVYYSTLSSVGKTTTTKSANITLTSATITGLTNNTAYYFVVTATNALGESAVSSLVSATPVYVRLAAPTGLSAVGVNGQVKLTWTAVTGAASYNVYWTQTISNADVIMNGTGGTVWTKVSNATSGGAITGFTNGTTYYFFVTAVSASGEGFPTSTISATPIAAALPAAPSGVTAKGGDGKVTVSWTSYLYTYNIYWSTSTGVTKTNGTKIAGVTSPYVHTGLTNGTPYYYIVTTENLAGESPASAQATATPQVPVAPVVVGTSHTEYTINVEFSKEMDISTFNAATFNISPAAPGTFTATGMGVKFSSSSLFTKETSYTVTINGVKDLDGLSPAQSYIWTFMTEPRKVLPVEYYSGWNCAGTTKSFSVYAYNETLYAQDIKICVNDYHQGSVCKTYTSVPPGGSTTTYKNQYTNEWYSDAGACWSSGQYTITWNRPGDTSNVKTDAYISPTWVANSPTVDPCFLGGTIPSTNCHITLTPTGGINADGTYTTGFYITGTSTTGTASGSGSSGSGTASGSGYSGPAPTDPDADGCYIPQHNPDCLVVEKKTINAENYAVVRLRNNCSARIYACIDILLKNGTWRGGCDGAKPGGSVSWDDYDATASYRYKYTGSVHWDADWVCADRDPNMK